MYNKSRTNKINNVSAKMKFILIGFLSIITVVAAFMIWSNAQAFEDPDYYNSDDNINWEELMSNYNNYYDYNNETQKSTVANYSYSIKIDINDDDYGNIYEFLGSDTPLSLPYTYKLECTDPVFDPSFRILNESIIFYDGSSESIVGPSEWFAAQANSGYAFKEWLVTDSSGNEIKPGIITEDLYCKAIFFEKTSISGYVYDPQGTGFPGASVEFITDIDTYSTTTEFLDLGAFSLNVPLNSTGILKIGYNDDITQAYLPVIIKVEDPIDEEGLNIGNVTLDYAATISGTVIDSDGQNVDATIYYYDNETESEYWTKTSSLIGRTSYSLPVPIGSTGVLYVESDDYVRAKRVINDPIPATGLHSVDFVLNEGITLTFNQGNHCTIYYNDEIASEAHVPVGAELEMIYDGYYGFINVWDPEAHGPGDYPYDIIACEPEEGYEFDTYTLNPEPTGGVLTADTTISASVKTRQDYNPILFGFVRDNYGYPVQKAYISFYDEQTGANTTVTTNSYGYYKLNLTTEAHGLVIVSAADFATTMEDITLPKDELYNQLDFTIDPGNDFILIGSTGHAMFSATFYYNGAQYGPTITLGNPEHLGVTDGGKLTVNTDNSITYVNDLIPNEVFSAVITPISQSAFDFISWVYREDVKQLMPGTTINIYDDTTLNANYQINIDKVAETFANYAGGNRAAGSPQTGDMNSLCVLLISIVAGISAIFIYRRKLN